MHIAIESLIQHLHGSSDGVLSAHSAQLHDIVAQQD